MNWYVCYTCDTHGLMQERHNSIANTLELHLSCTYPSIYSIDGLWYIWWYCSLALSFWYTLCNIVLNVVYLGKVTEGIRNIVFHTNPGSHFTNSLWANEWNFVIKFIFSGYDSNDLIKSQLYICQCSWDVNACTKLLSDQIIISFM